jgi:phosphotransferase system IIB component
LKIKKQKNEVENMEAKLMKTKKGNGFKIVVGDEWVYASKTALEKMLNDESGVCTFKPIENNGGEYLD